MMHLNSSMIEQASSLLTEFDIPHTSAEAPGCATLTFSLAAHESHAARLLAEHFGNIVSLVTEYDRMHTNNAKAHLASVGSQVQRRVAGTHTNADCE